MSFLLKNYLLVEVVYLFIRCIKTKLFLWNTIDNDRNKQKRHIKHLEKDNIAKAEGGGGGVPTKSLHAFEVWFFDSAREASNDLNIFLNLRFIKKQKPAGFFWRKYYILTSSKLRMFHWMYLNIWRKQY